MHKPWFLILAAVGLPAAASLSSLAHAAGRDYEAEARALYRFEPDYEKQWPVEFHIRVLEPLTQDVARTAFNLGEGTGPDHFASDVTVQWGQMGPSGQDVGLESTKTPWAMDERAKKVDATGAADAWKKYLSGFRYVDVSVLKIKQLEVTGEGHAKGKASLHVSGRASDGSLRDDSGKVELAFARTSEGWRIDGMRLLNLTTTARAEPMFTDVTDQWLRADEPAYKRLRRFSASDDIHRKMLDGKLPEGSRLQPVAMDAHPGVALVDLDGDRWDDLLVWDVTGPATFLHNDHGTLVPGELRGVDLEGVSAAAFGDLNNDGATDLALGRWASRSTIYFGRKAKDGGLSFEASHVVAPSEVATISLVDVNRDGKLDVFFGTAANDYHTRAVATGRVPETEADANVNMVGPPNVLLVNTGDGFEDQTSRRGLQLQRNTLQAAFADFNEDGWPDVFFGNDFAPGNLMVNHNGVFTDISDEAGATDIYFGMGASWGDFDADGDLDLYASAMSSSAGKRIMSDEGNFDPNLPENDRRARHQAARGNTLLRNDGDDRFTDATSGGPYAAARGANWAYGAQFFDANGDGYEDIMSPNGFFTPSGLRPEQTFRDL